MPLGEHSWETWKGPRVPLNLRLATETHLLLQVAATQLGTSTSGLATELLERWSAEWLRGNAAELREVVAAEKERRA
jgi:hypothetical protein